MPLFGNGPSSAPQAPPAPALPRAPRPAVQASSSSPSHVDFLFSQVRASLQQLHLRGNLLAKDYSEITSVLDRAELKQDEEKPSFSLTKGEGETEEELGKRNAWMRETLEETMLLPAIVEASLNVTAGPLLSDNQKDAILSLVERSQKKIAQLVTNPSNQRVARDAPLAGVKAVSKSISTGVTAARETSADLLAKRREQSRAKREAQAERKALRAELKREREEIVRKRAEALQAGTHSASKDDELERRDQQLKDQEDALGPDDDDNDNADGEEDDDETHAAPSRAMSSGRLVTSPISASRNPSFSSLATRNVPPPLPGTAAANSLSKSATHSQNGALASVYCTDLNSASSKGLTDDVASSAATTTFSPWPGLLLSQTLVVTSGDPRDLQAKSEAIVALAGKDGSVDVKSLRSTPNPSVNAPDSASSFPPTRSTSSTVPQAAPGQAPVPPPIQTSTPAAPAAAPLHPQSAPKPTPAPNVPPAAAAARPPAAPAAPPPVPRNAAQPTPVPSSNRPAAPLDATAPPPFGTVVDVTETKKKGGFGKFLGK